MTSQPINISQSNIVGVCDLKCSYNFNYTETNITGRNEGTTIAITTDNNKTAPVLFNNEKYFVSRINIYSPSLHLYNNRNVNAELIITHTPELGGDNLYVCIPIVQNQSSNSESSNLLTEIITIMSQNAPRNGDTTNINISNFSLEKIVPRKTFFSYKNTTQMSGNYVVFRPIDAITLTSSTLNTLRNIITRFALQMTGSNLFINSNGPGNLGNNGNDIYISCQPTGTSEEETEVTNNKKSMNMDLLSIFENGIIQKIFKFLLGGFFLILIFFVISIAYNYVIGRTTRSIPV